MSLELGTNGFAEYTVTGRDLATTISQKPTDEFPPVWATSSMIGLMELAGSRVLHPLLEEGQLSVGVSIEASHIAATPVGATVTAEAKFVGMDEKLYVFEVIARDAGGEIGRGIHKRAIVSSERLVAGAARRCPVSAS